MGDVRVVPPVRIVIFSNELIGTILHIMSQSSPASEQLSKLRGVVQQALENHLYDSAIFFADKLITLSNNDLEDLYLLAQAYYETSQYRRAIHTLNRPEKLSQKCKYLVAKCKSKLGDWDGVIEVLQDEYSVVAQTVDADKTVLAAIYVLLGEAYEAVDQRSRAAQCYRLAVKNDVTCFEAFRRLVDGFMQTSNEEADLLQSLKFPADMPWLEHVYRAKMKRFVDQLPIKTGRSASIEETYSRIQEAYGLAHNEDILHSKAEDYLYCNQPHKTYEITKKALERDPFNYGNLLLVHVSALVSLQLKNELFYLAHKVVEEDPKLPIGWYTVGCYYLIIRNYPQARRYFHKATVMDKEFGAAWLAFGHTFAAEGEPDQALAAYRTAARLLIGSHIPPLCIGMELIRSNNPSLGLDFAVKAFKMRPEDPLILNEIGVCLIRGNQFDKAADHFVRALDLVGSRITDFWEPTLFNLAHCYRKLRQYDLAAKYYSKALGLAPSNPNTYTALGLTCHLQGKLDQAVEHYHHALSLQPEDPTFASELLQRALEESFCDVLPISHTFAPLLVEPQNDSLELEASDDDV